MLHIYSPFWSLEIESLPASWLVIDDVSTDDGPWGFPALNIGNFLFDFMNAGTVSIPVLSGTLVKDADLQAVAVMAPPGKHDALKGRAGLSDEKDVVQLLPIDPNNFLEGPVLVPSDNSQVGMVDLLSMVLPISLPIVILLLAALSVDLFNTAQMLIFSTKK